MDSRKSLTVAENPNNHSNVYVVLACIWIPIKLAEYLKHPSTTS